VIPDASDQEGNQYYFGAKAQLASIARKRGALGLHVAASVHDKHMLPDLLHGEEKKVWATRLSGQTKVIHAAAPGRRT